MASRIEAGRAGEKACRSPCFYRHWPTIKLNVRKKGKACGGYERRRGCVRVAHDEDVVVVAISIYIIISDVAIAIAITIVIVFWPRYDKQEVISLDSKSHLPPRLYSPSLFCLCPVSTFRHDLS